MNGLFRKNTKVIWKRILGLLLMMVILLGLCGCGDKEAEKQTESRKEDTLPVMIDGGCRALTKRFVKGAMGEDYSALAYNVTSFAIDEEENGTIQVRYLPSNAGEEGATKVDLTIRLHNDVYTIEYALLAGLYEVDLTQVPLEYIQLNTSDE